MFGKLLVKLVLVCFILIMSATLALARYNHVPTSKDVPNPQYINIAPLPGAGIAIDHNGDPDGRGAFQINIPVAYTPRWGYIGASAYKGNHPDRQVLETGNGSGVFGAGFGNNPSFFISGMQVSRILDESQAVSSQLSLVKETKSLPAISGGVQDVLMKEANGRSVYFVATKQVTFGKTPAFATVGFGGGRFLNQPIAGLSVPLGGWLNIAAEYDGYQMNTGLGWRPGGQKGWATLLTAYNGKTGWLFGVGTAFKTTRD